MYMYVCMYMMSCQLFLPASLSFVGRGASSCDWWCLGEKSGGSSTLSCLRHREGAPSGGVVGKARQAVKDAKPISSPPSLAI